MEFVQHRAGKLEIIVPMPDVVEILQATVSTGMAYWIKGGSNPSQQMCLGQVVHARHDAFQD